MDISAQLADLGAQLQQALVAAYLPKVGAQTVLTFLPGEPVPSTLVQQGMVNPTQVTAWLGTVADTPLLVQTEQAVVMGGPSGDLDRMTDIYDDLVQFAQPIAAPGTDESTRVAEEIASARADAGPGVRPLDTSPSDWPLPIPKYWTLFTYGQPAQQPPTGPGQAVQGGGSPAPPPAGVHQGFAPSPIWALRSIPKELLSAPSRLGPPSKQAPGSPDPARAAISVKSVGAPAGAVRQVALEDVSAVPVTRGLSQLPPYLRLINLPHPAPGPAPSTPAPMTQVSLQHMLVMIDRSSWWHQDLVTDPGWFVPGLTRGAWVAPPPAQQQAYAVPVALLLVQDLTLTGSWSAEDTATLTKPGTMLGPFDLGTASVAGSRGTTVTISVPDMHLIGVFCEPLPVLPPNDPPASGSPATASPSSQSAGAGAGSSPPPGPSPSTLAASGSPATASASSQPAGPSSSEPAAPSSSPSAASSGSAQPPTPPS